MRNQRHKLALIFFAILFGFFGYLFFSKESLNTNNLKEVNLKHNSKPLSLYYWGEIPKFNPIHPDGLYVWWIQNLVWDRIINVDKNYIWEPAIAQSWSFNSDRTVLKLKINPEIVWSNGRPLDQDDFIYSYHFYKDPELKAALYEPILSRIKTINYKNNILTLKLDEKLKSDPFYATPIYWSHIMNTVKLYPKDQKSNPYLGTGAFKVDQFSNQGLIKLSLNKKSWFFKKYKNTNLASNIRVKSLSSESLLEKIVENSQGIVLGKDISSLMTDTNNNSYEKQNSTYNEIPNTKSNLINGPHIFSNINLNTWHPVESKLQTVSIAFNLKKIIKPHRMLLYRIIQQLNDVEKLNLNYKNINVHKFNEPEFDLRRSSLTSYKLKKLNPDQIEKRKEIFKKNKLSSLDLNNHKLNDSKSNKLNISIELLYSNPSDEKWLTYLNEKLKDSGIKLNLILVSQAVFQEKIFAKDYEAFVDVNSKSDFYPHYLSFHSKGSYNVVGWDILELDLDLEKMIKLDKPNEIQSLIQKIRNDIDKEFFEVPIFSYDGSVLWTRNPCKPIQTQFQGLGLIYKAIICADNL